MGAMHDGATTTVEGPIATEDESLPDVELGLALIWSDSEPSRIGELLIPRAEASWFGRDPGDVECTGSIESSAGRTLELTPDVRAQIRERAPARGSGEITTDDLRASLQRNEGVLERVWRDLRLPNRHALRRLMRKQGEA